MTVSIHRLTGSLHTQRDPRHLISPLGPRSLLRRYLRGRGRSRAERFAQHLADVDMIAFFDDPHSRARLAYQAGSTLLKAVELPVSISVVFLLSFGWIERDNPKRFILMMMLPYLLIGNFFKSTSPVYDNCPPVSIFTAELASFGGYIYVKIIEKYPKEKKMQDTKQLDLLRGRILPTLVKLALPIMATSFVGLAYTLTDMFWVSTSANTRSRGSAQAAFYFGCQTVCSRSLVWAGGYS